MQLIHANASVESFTPNAEQLIEAAGRTCYKSEGKSDGTLEGAQKFCSGLVKRGHTAVIEHASATVRFVVDRGVSHEIVRHRVASYCQESTRYCNYGNGDQGVTFIIPNWGDLDCADAEDAMLLWQAAMKTAESVYLELLRKGWTPQQARTVLPNSTKTEVVMTANMREWRHFFQLRCSNAAHPQIQEVARPLLQVFKTMWPSLFEDITW